MAVSVVEAGPCYVVRVKTPESDGYRAVQLGYGDIKEKRVNKPLAGQFKRADLKPLRFLREFRGMDDSKLKAGDKIGSDVFTAGDRVFVSGRSKGRGFTGVMKRHGFAGKNRTHGTHESFRGPGSIGACATPGRVFKGKKLPGRMGNARVTVRNLKVVRVDPEKNLLFLKGAVPGARNGILEIKKVTGP